MNKVQVVIEDVVDSKLGIIGLKFRSNDGKLETPRFLINVKQAKSYTKWKITMTEEFEGEELKKLEKMFEEAIKIPEFEIVFGEEYKSSEIDGELLCKLIQLTIWVETITCSKPEFSASDNDISVNVSGARKINVVMA